MCGSSLNPIRVCEHLRVIKPHLIYLSATINLLNMQKNNITSLTSSLWRAIGILEFCTSCRGGKRKCAIKDIFPTRQLVQFCIHPTKKP
jgi:hypothetical protein